jgi:hypothetical protein
MYIMQNTHGIVRSLDGLMNGHGPKYYGQKIILKVRYTAFHTRKRKRGKGVCINF